MTGWQSWIGRGGSFTDVIGLPSGELHIGAAGRALRRGSWDSRGARDFGAASAVTASSRGDAVRRRPAHRIRTPLSGALLASHRRIATFGLDGGAPGDVGKGRLLRAAGRTEEIGATASFKVEAGDMLTIPTPGGGGFGAAGGDAGNAGEGISMGST